MNKIILIFSALLLSGCYSGVLSDMKPAKTPNVWTSYKDKINQSKETKDLHKWWQKFDDPALNELIIIAFENSPQRGIAEARILEARGIRRTTRSFLFPQIGASAQTGQQDTGMSDGDNFYEATFDASYEIDIFGRNRNATKAATASIKNLEENYYNVTLTMIGEIARDYIDYRRFQTQADIAQKNLDVQEKTLKLVRNLKKFGEAPQLDVEQAENLVNTTKSSIPEFERLAQNARLRLSVLTGELDQDLSNILNQDASIPTTDIMPVLIAPADIIALRPDVRAATYNLTAATALTEAAIADLYPKFTLSGFFGVTKSALVSSTSIWNVSLGAAVSLIDFGRIEGQIDAARAIEKRAFEAYRLATLEAVRDVETALSDYAHLNEQEQYLYDAFQNAQKALKLSQLLYQEGEVSFLNVLQAQRTLNDSDRALINIKADRSQSLIRLYKSIGVY